MFREERAQIVVTRLVDVQRQNHLRSQCRLMNVTSDLNSVLKDEEFLSHVIVDEQQKLLYCYVPKVIFWLFPRFTCRLCTFF
jgi:hypothetical protein